MRNVTTAGAALLLTTSLAQAGGLDRTGNAYSVLFEEGNYVQLSFSSASPEVSGEYPGGMFGTGSTENMAKSYSSMGFALKYAVSDQVDLALFVNQPFGADAEYTTGLYDGLAATWNNSQVSAVAKYQAAPGVSVYGGLRAVESQPEIAIPESLIRIGLGRAALSTDPVTAGTAQAILAANAVPGNLGYSAETESDTQIGYVVGAAYERPEIALRVSLTYESGVTHEFDTSETLIGVGLDGLESTTKIKMPQSLALDFQTGVAADTLVFGSLRWSEWSVWDVRPVGYETLTGGSVTGLDNDVMTYRLGVGRRVSDELSVFGRVTYEKANGGIASRLTPTDGSISYGFGGSYAFGDVEISGGIEYAMLGDANDGLVEFADNTALGYGVNIGFSF